MASEVSTARIPCHMDRYGIGLRDLVWKTDCDGEFVGRVRFSQAPGGQPARQAEVTVCSLGRGEL